MVWTPPFTQKIKEINKNDFFGKILFSEPKCTKTCDCPNAKITRLVTVKRAWCQLFYNKHRDRVYTCSIQNWKNRLSKSPQSRKRDLVSKTASWGSHPPNRTWVKLSHNTCFSPACCLRELLLTLLLDSHAGTDGGGAIGTCRWLEQITYATRRT